MPTETLVNGKRIADQRVLEAGDELTVGSVKFRVERLEETALMPDVTPPPILAHKPGDTAMSQAIATEEDSAIMDFDEEDLEETPSPKPQSAPAVAAAVESEDDAIEIGEDDVADYLLNIELDDEDKL